MRAMTKKVSIEFIHTQIAATFRNVFITVKKVARIMINNSTELWKLNSGGAL